MPKESTCKEEDEDRHDDRTTHNDQNQRICNIDDHMTPSSPTTNSNLSPEQKAQRERRMVRFTGFLSLAWNWISCPRPWFMIWYDMSKHHTYIPIKLLKEWDYLCLWCWPIINRSIISYHIYHIASENMFFFSLLNWQIKNSNVIYPSQTYPGKKKPKTYISGIHVDHPPSKYFQAGITNRRHGSPNHRNQIETEVSAPPLSLLSTKYVPSCCKIHILKIKPERSPNVSDTVKTHIRFLHSYNEIKDVGQGLMGLIAEARGVRYVDVQREFGIEAGDWLMRITSQKGWTCW